MPQFERLRLHDIQQVADLIEEVGELGSNATAWRTHALHGLARLLHGTVGVTLDFEGFGNGRLPLLLDPLDVGWTTSSGRRIYYEYLQTQVCEDPGAKALFDGHRSIRFLTATREQLIDDQSWYRSPAVAEMRRAGSVDDFISSSIRLQPDRLQGFVIYRPWGEKRFTVRHRRLLRLFHLWLLRRYGTSLTADPPADLVAALPPRVRQTYDLLMMGDSMKQISAKLQISRHTVNDYTKTLYRRLGVSGRMELLKMRTSPAQKRLVLPRSEPGLRTPQ